MCLAAARALCLQHVLYVSVFYQRPHAEMMVSYLAGVRKQLLDRLLTHDGFALQLLHLTAPLRRHPLTPL